MCEEENERDHYWKKHHPLALVETRSKTDKCFICKRNFSSGEKVYGCGEKCRYPMHQECAGLPMKIKHAMHPQHILSQVFHNRYDTEAKACAICGEVAKGVFYRCTSAECMFVMHIRCAQGNGLIDAADDDDDDEQRGSIIDHPSHPRHKLRFTRKCCSFMCDACGTTHEGKSYMCCKANCHYWIHETCASSDLTIKREDHHHPLSLSFHVPPLYMKYDYKCDVCSQYLLSKYWIYHCQLCSYAVHLKCAYKKSPQAREKNDDEKRIMVFPISDVGEDQIGAFVRRQGVNISIPPTPHHDVDYEFHNHKLILVPSSPEEEEDSDDDGEDQYGRKKSELICDGCITPIFRKQRSLSSSSSSSSKDCCYMSCSSGCNYNLHMACFHLPPRLPSIPFHSQSGHDLILGSFDEILYEYCHVCGLSSNGLIYKCTKCLFKADIKCASMPNTIYHTAHPQHPLNLLGKHDVVRRQDYKISCWADCKSSYLDDYYKCGSCEFSVHVGCAMVSTSNASRRWDRHHPLLLTYDAYLNHPGEFYCDECEIEMNPKSWMYHCRWCDISFHPKCFITTSGLGRNIKFGKEYVNAAAHPHPLAFQLLTTKRRCNFCREDNYEWPGFHCASCNYFICYYKCGKKMLGDGDMKVVDRPLKYIDIS
ncbi:uncharacterized protein LOC130991682 [Salvia miltiorrhiza]|uniref:uncharacterized protein LOC130991682 n=1 Tax=Salvia miltiorrhiza TaxID=226208 RepID=UPI0025AD6314|nr:uncharacterized protein LOC130991682 [Salvia miltiorrhiza]